MAHIQSNCVQSSTICISDRTIHALTDMINDCVSNAYYVYNIVYNIKCELV